MIIMIATITFMTSAIDKLTNSFKKNSTLSPSCEQIQPDFLLPLQLLFQPWKLLPLHHFFTAHCFCVLSKKYTKYIILVSGRNDTIEMINSLLKTEIWWTDY